MGRRMKPRPRAPRWTGYKKEYPRRLYWALMTDEIMKPTHSALAAVLGVHSNSILKWMHKYPAMPRAVERAIHDRIEKTFAAGKCLTVKYDPQTFDWDKKTLRGVVKNAKVISRSFDYDRYDTMTAHIHMRKNRWRDGHPRTVRYIILDFGPLSNYKLAEHFAIAESTLRMWRKTRPEFEAAIREAEEEWRAVQAEQAWLNTPMTWAEMRERGLIRD